MQLPCRALCRGALLQLVAGLRTAPPCWPGRSPRECYERLLWPPRASMEGP